MNEIERILQTETNECTALILVLNEFNSKLTQINALIKDLNKLSTDINNRLNLAISPQKQGTTHYYPVDKEDYME